MKKITFLCCLYFIGLGICTAENAETLAKDRTTTVNVDCIKHLADAIEWPDNFLHNNNVSICILSNADHPLFQALQYSNQENALRLQYKNNLKFTLLALSNYINNRDELTPASAKRLVNDICAHEMLYLSKETKQYWHRLEKQLTAQPILTIASWKSFQRTGGMVFYDFFVEAAGKDTSLILNKDLLKSSDLELKIQRLEKRHNVQFYQEASATFATIDE